MKCYYYWYNLDNHRLTEFVCREIPKGITPTDYDVSSFGTREWFFGYTDVYRKWTNQQKKIIKILQ